MNKLQEGEQVTLSDVTKFSHSRFHNVPDQQVFKVSTSHAAKTLPKATDTRDPKCCGCPIHCVYADNTWRKNTDPPSLSGTRPRKALLTQTDDNETEQEDEDDDVIDNNQVRALLTIHRHIPDETNQVFSGFFVPSCEANEATVRHVTSLLKTERFARLTVDD